MGMKRGMDFCPSASCTRANASGMADAIECRCVDVSLVLGVTSGLLQPLIADSRHKRARFFRNPAIAAETRQQVCCCTAAQEQTGSKKRCPGDRSPSMKDRVTRH
jgi:hypothetical protein